MRPRQSLQKITSSKAIAEHGASAARRKLVTTRGLVILAMRDMQKELRRNNWIYPFTEDGRVSIQEVLRRAGKSSAALEKPWHKVAGGLKEKVSNWVARMNRVLPRSVQAFRHLISSRADEADARLHALRQVWVEAELEYIEAGAALLKKDAEILELKAIIARLEGECDSTAASLPKPPPSEVR